MTTLRIQLLFACLLTAVSVLLFTLCFHISAIHSRTSPKKDIIRPIIIHAEQKNPNDDNDCDIDGTGCCPCYYHYEYEPEWLPLPDGATVEHANSSWIRSVVMVMV